MATGKTNANKSEPVLETATVLFEHYRSNIDYIGLTDDGYAISQSGLAGSHSVLKNSIIVITTMDALSPTGGVSARPESDFHFLVTGDGSL